MANIPFTRLAASLPASVPFVGPEAMERARGSAFDARIGANESACGPSPRALEAMIAALETGEPRLYGDPESHALRTALARRHGIAPDEIVVDAGIDTLLGLSVRLFMEAEDTAIGSLGAYPTFAYHVAGFGGRLEAVPYRALHEDPDALLAASHEHAARLVYLANPDNPMGTRVDREAVANLIDSLPGRCLLLLDEAYAEYTDETLDPVNPPIDTADPRVIRFRTFSKAWGMAGMRIGYAIGHRDVIAGFERVRNHFGVNRLAQVAALASLGDAGHLERVRASVRAGRARIEALADSHGIAWVASATNFVALDFGDAARAEAVMGRLLDVGIFLRKPAVPPLDRHVRVGVGTDAELAALGLAAWDGKSVVDGALLQANHAAYRDLTPADLPGVRALVDGRAWVRPETWGEDVPHVVIGAPRATLGASTD